MTMFEKLIDSVPQDCKLVYEQKMVTVNDLLEQGLCVCDFFTIDDNVCFRYENCYDCRYKEYDGEEFIGEIVKIVEGNVKMTYRDKLVELLGDDHRIFYECDEDEFESCPSEYFVCKDDCSITCHECCSREYNGEQFTDKLDEMIYRRTIVPPHSSVVPSTPATLIDKMVEHPEHYNAHNIEVIDFIMDWELNFQLGNVIKYVCRSPYKGTALQDLLKAQEYLQFEIDRVKNLEQNN